MTASDCRNVLLSKCIQMLLDYVSDNMPTLHFLVDWVEVFPSDNNGPWLFIS